MELLALIVLCSWVYKKLFVKEETRPLPDNAYDVLHGGE